jgi:hypothetical protein
MEVVWCRDCRCEFDSKQRPDVEIAPLDAYGLNTRAFKQIDLSEAAGVRKHQAAKKPADRARFFP